MFIVQFININIPLSQLEQHPYFYDRFDVYFRTVTYKQTNKPLKSQNFTPKGTFAAQAPNLS